jgi:hypothetical protein
MIPIHPGEGATMHESARSWKPMTVALAAAGVLAGWSTLLPESIRPWNFAFVGAVALFAAARLSAGSAIAVLALSVAVKDVCMLVKYDLPPEPFSWLAFAGYFACGRLLRRTESPAAIGGAALGAGLVFFLVSNFGSWLMQALPYGYSLEGLKDCYAAAIPFHRGTLASDLLGTATLFALHAALVRAWFPAERVAAETIPVHTGEDGW